MVRPCSGRGTVPVDVAVSPSGEAVCALNRVRAAGSQGFYLEKIRVFKAGAFA